MTGEPMWDELAHRFPGHVDTQGPLDACCCTGWALLHRQDEQYCAGGSSAVGRPADDGGGALRGRSYRPTRERLFHVAGKSRDHVLKLYGSATSDVMLPSGGQAVYFSSDFAA